ncbi:Ubiquitin domain-containing protein 1 [Coemansia brasiliensis]|uniref:Ubiquitin domain-containing protein 1 n=1 Tax=Coemansia brasiliensis TaxID=2650707 RepID=A0A9W8LYT1_9FUNG|nr:Ubiquitin domain-containing protein 1 [Coemansia brasiliensis]
MGCCQSTAHAATLETNTETEAAAVATESPPRHSSTLDFGHTTLWAAEDPLTAAMLQRKRAEFWETAPAFEGRVEIWLGLRMACESDDMQLAQAIIESLNVVVPNGRIVDGVYDERGACYEIPQYCLSSPTNLMPDSSKLLEQRASVDSGGMRTAVMAAGSNSSSPSMTALTAKSPIPPIQMYRLDDTDSQSSPASPWHMLGSGFELGSKVSLRIRLSTGTDIGVQMPRDVTVAQLEQQLRESGHVSNTQHVHMFYLGRLLKPDSAPARDSDLPKSAILQALIS